MVDSNLEKKRRVCVQEEKRNGNMLVDGNIKHSAVQNSHVQSKSTMIFMMQKHKLNNSPTEETWHSK